MLLHTVIFAKTSICIATFLVQHITHIHKNILTHIPTAIRQTYNLAMNPNSPIGVGQEVTFTCTSEGLVGNVMHGNAVLAVH